MADVIHIAKFDESYITVTGDDALLREMSDQFTFMVPDAQHIPAVKNKFWDGKIRLFDMRNGRLYLGLHTKVKAWCNENGYECVYDDPLDVETEFSVVEFRRMVELLNLSRTADEGRVSVEVHDYQERAVIHAIQSGRSLLLSPTASGKSLIIYLLVRYYLARTKGKILIVVPRGNLVDQMYEDFKDYAGNINWNVETYCHKVYDGAKKHTDKRVVITTWQSLAMKERLPKELRDKMNRWQIAAWNKKAEFILDQEYFDQFETVFGDEAHKFVADELTKVMVRLTNARYRHGTTGTIQDTKVHHLILEGLFGGVYQTTTTRKMIDDGKAADLEINILQLGYTKEERKVKRPYPDEMKFLQAHAGRNRFICNLALSLKGNTLILYEKVELHGQIIYDQILSNISPTRKLFFVHGEIKPDERNEIRLLTEEEEDAIIVASYGTYSEGVSIRNIDNVISVATGKSKIRLFQSIGRGLRVSSRKTKMRWYDVVDDLSHWNKSRTEVRDNYGMQHLQERIGYYNSEQFEYRTYKIELTNYDE